jgi:hypothetical protein
MLGWGDAEALELSRRVSKRIEQLTQPLVARRRVRGADVAAEHAVGGVGIEADARHHSPDRTRPTHR